jgi:hypothetical protein
MKKKVGSSKSMKKYQDGGQDKSKAPYVTSVGPRGGTQTVDTTGLASGAKRFKVSGVKPEGRTVEFETNRKGAERVVEASKTPGKKHKSIRVVGGRLKANPPYKESPLDGFFKKGGSLSKMKKGGSVKKTSKKK